MKKVCYIAILSISLCICSTFSLTAEPATGPVLTKADHEELASAIGHYARSRSLLIAALKEFDNGLRYASPEQVVDVKEMRHTFLDQAEALKRILAPQPRSTKYGVRFEADTRLLSDVNK